MHSKEHLSKRLKKRGWSDLEIAHANAVWDEHHKKHHVIHPIYDRTLRILVFLTILVSVVFISFLLLPILAFTRQYSYLFIGGMGLLLGAMFELVVYDLTNVQKRHVFFYFLGLPFVIFFMMYFLLVYLVVMFEAILQPPLLLSLVYTLCFFVPSVIRIFRNL